VTALEAPDFAEPIEAWRAWRVVMSEDGLRLGSVVKATVWPAREALVAACLRPRAFRWFNRRHLAAEAPGADCDCGIYAAWLEDAGSYLRDAADALSVGRVIGRVSLWGTVVECERGFRASHAYPSVVYVLRDSVSRRKQYTAAGIADELRSYDVPVELVDASCVEVVSTLGKRCGSLMRRGAETGNA